MEGAFTQTRFCSRARKHILRRVYNIPRMSLVIIGRAYNSWILDPSLEEIEKGGYAMCMIGSKVSRHTKA